MKTDVKLELIRRTPEVPNPNLPPLLFIHGAFVGAWCWDEHFLPWFAEAGFDASAVSLTGHGLSPGRDRLDSVSISDYVDDVREVVQSLPAPPVLIGHSMGGFVVQKYLETYEAPAAVLLCSVPPQGLMGPAMSMMFSKPTLLSDLNNLMSGGRTSLDSLRDALFAQDVSVDALMRYYTLSQPESHRAIWDMTLFGLPHTRQVLAHLPGGAARMLVMGAELDHLVPPSAAEMTGRSYGTEPVVFDGMGHGLMLEKDWQRVARSIQVWLSAIFA